MNTKNTDRIDFRSVFIVSVSGQSGELRRFTVDHLQGAFSANLLTVVPLMSIHNGTLSPLGLVDDLKSAGVRITFPLSKDLKS